LVSTFGRSKIRSASSVRKISATSLSLLAQRTFQENRLYGEGAALSVITFILVMLVAFAYIRLVGGNIRGMTEDR
jgi:multiple sugar transport system permease protein